MLNIDEKQTVANSKRVISSYENYKRLSQRDVDNDVTKDALKHVEAIESSLEQTNSDLYKFILENRFINGYKYLDIAKHVGLGHSQFGRKQHEALLAFAEAYPLENLIVLQEV
ncbi:hypothetical protein [Pediococcus pentosaceus]|uniref:hypothetical protein n=1 Tax=Pediococcus pentosaceus TaxID=1255 RepID=UPI001C7D827F|nr:hypothetical protein [Pediococcus pentosaceus]QYY85505.1 hypothetical protein GRI00_02595 [Pediococcus pentosaceus]